MKRFETDQQSVFFASSERLDFVENQSVDLIVTSPPYWNLKDYGHSNQIGASDYDEYLDRLNRVWSECYRVAKPEEPRGDSYDDFESTDYE